jgi:hypothetical protein
MSHSRGTGGGAVFQRCETAVVPGGVEGPPGTASRLGSTLLRLSTFAVCTLPCTSGQVAAQACPLGLRFDILFAE